MNKLSMSIPYCHGCQGRAKHGLTLFLWFFITVSLAQANAAGTYQTQGVLPSAALHYEFLPVPARVAVGQSVTLTMAGCIDPLVKAAPACPEPVTVADSVSASAGTIRQISPAGFVYTAPATLPDPNLVLIRANYSRPSRQEVIGIVLVTIDPVGRTGLSIPPVPASGQALRVLGFVNVLASNQGAKGWARNRFIFLGSALARQEVFTNPDENFGVNFDRAIGTWDYQWVDAKGNQHFEHGHNYFVGDDVFSYLTINFSKGAYAWQAHLDRLGDESSDIKFSGADLIGKFFDPKNNIEMDNKYQDLGYQSICDTGLLANGDLSKVSPVALHFKPAGPGQPPWAVNLYQYLAACPKDSAYGSGVFMESYFSLWPQ